MNRKTAISLLVSVAVIGASSFAFAAEPETEQQKQADADKTLALTAMGNMSEYLRSLDTFTVHAAMNIDEVLANGQKLQLTKSAEIRADRPSGMWAKSSTMYSDREFYYDGKLFTIYTPQLGMYASFDAPPTIGEVVAKAQQEYDVELPLADLFLWGTGADALDSVDEAIIVGVDQVDGVSCNHFAFRQQEIDWQICIQRGDTPLPLKLVITSKDEPAQPQYAAVLKWDTGAVLGNQSYTFIPHEGDHKISFEKTEAGK